jgi:hypothetical protein
MKPKNAKIFAVKTKSWSVGWLFLFEEGTKSWSKDFWTPSCWKMGWCPFDK